MSDDDRIRFFNLANKEWRALPDNTNRAFVHSMRTATYLVPDAFLNDDSLVWFRSCGFMDDPELNSALGGSSIMRSRWWRMHVLCWAASQALSIGQDFVDVGCYDGKTVAAIQDYVGAPVSYWVYDIFDDPPPESRKEFHGPELQSRVQQRLGPQAHVIRSDGSTCPELPKRIAFLQTDLNGADAELAWMLHLYPRLELGALIVHDDYGWTRYRETKEVLDGFLAARGHRVLELPTGQGMWIR